jgi:hypothetical protein
MNMKCAGSVQKDETGLEQRPTLGTALAMHCNENPIYVFLFWELLCLSSNVHIHVSVSDDIFPGSVHILPAAEYADLSWEYIKCS